VTALALAAALFIAVPQARAVSTAGLDRVLGAGGLRDLDGRVWTRADLAGRVVLVDVWATWCAPCLADMPTLRRLTAEHEDRLVILGVSVDTMPRRDFVSWLSRRDVSWPQVFDGRGYSGPLPSRLGIDAVPASWLFGPDGRLAARDLRGHALDRAVRDLLAGWR
jgi:thiol-disulfide isomerase/thioredoxin